jgi:hypothetical protein
MKRLFHILIILLTLALAPAGAFADGGTYYVDYTCSGCDSTGTGAWDDPWGTIGKCTTDGATTGGGECRVAKMTPTALDGNLTFTNGSLSVTTSVDEQGNVSAGDFVGLNATDEAWWRVASLTSSVITLDYQYWGPGTGVATAGYEAVYFTLAGDIDINSAGTSMSSRLKISGGWTLSASSTQDGVSFFSNYGLTFDIISTNTNNFFEFSDFVFFVNVAYSYGEIYGTTRGSVISDIQWIGCRWEPLSGSNVTGWNTFENIIQAGGYEAGIYGYSHKYYFTTNFISYSAGTASGDDGFDTSGYGGPFIYDGLSIYNAWHNGVDLYQVNNAYLSNVIIDTVRDGDGLYFNAADHMYVDDIAISNIVDDGIMINDAYNCYINNPTFSGIGDVDVRTYAPGSSTVVARSLVITNYEGVAGDDRSYFGSYDQPAPYVGRDTADARSGTCLKFYSYDEFDPIYYKVGTFKATDGAEDITLSVYMKDNAAYDGVVRLYSQVLFKRPGGVPEVKTMTDSYVQQSITVSSDDFATGDYVHLYVTVCGTDGNVFVDDFTASN